MGERLCQESCTRRLRNQEPVWSCLSPARESGDEQMERLKAGRRYLSLGSSQHVLLLLKDGVDTLKELGALLGNPAKTSRKQIDDDSSRPGD